MSFLFGVELGVAAGDKVHVGVLDHRRRRTSDQSMSNPQDWEKRNRQVRSDEVRGVKRLERVPRLEKQDEGYEEDGVVREIRLQG